MTKHSPVRSVTEAKALLNEVKVGVKNSSFAHIFPKEIIEVMATDDDPFEKIMEDREEIIRKSHNFINQINSVEQIMDAAETGNEEGLTYESVGKDFLEFQETSEKQLIALKDLTDVMKVRIKKALEWAKEQIGDDTTE